MPEVFIWMLCGGKRVAYTRIPSQHLVYSLVEEERGKDAGRMQTVFLRVSGATAHCLGHAYVPGFRMSLKRVKGCVLMS